MSRVVKEPSRCPTKKYQYCSSWRAFLCDTLAFVKAALGVAKVRSDSIIHRGASSIKSKSTQYTDALSECTIIDTFYYRILIRNVSMCKQYHSVVSGRHADHGWRANMTYFWTKTNDFIY